MLGLYVHIPFCARRCPYCDFAIHIGAREKFVQEYVAALKTELRQVLAEDARPFSTIYFGGGTPTFLEAEVLASLLELVREHHAVEADAEITIEANPENLESHKPQILREGGFNRLSLGVQSLDDDALRLLGRVHRAEDVERAVRLARECGWGNISLDLIYAVPNQSPESWRQTLQRSTQLPISHISCYSLTIEETTPFARRVASGVLVPVEDDAQADLMEETELVLGAAGLQRYETSNYARPRFESRHNRNYWSGGDYLAVGCGAHGHLNGVRWWNERQSQKYVELIEAQGNARAGEEVLTPRQRLDELVMLGLRTREGFSLREVSERAGIDAASTLNGQLHKLIEDKWLQRQGERVSLAPHAASVADGVAARLLAE